MLELSRPDVAVIRCCARRAALDELARPEPCGRIAPDELLLLAPSGEDTRVLVELSAQLAGSDPSPIVIDHSDAFFVLGLSGSSGEALARLSPIALPDDGFGQGPVAGVPCKVFVTPGKLLLLAPSTYEHHVRERIGVACADLDVRDRALAAAPSLAEATIV